MSNINWDELGIPDYEDPVETKVRLDAIHRQILLDKGIDTKPAKNSPGFRPSSEQARQVAVMSALGLDPKDIALVLNIELKLLNIYYAKELKVSHNLANAMVARQALQMAMSGRFPDMTKFWLTHRGGWKPSKDDPPGSLDKKGEDLGSAKDRLKQMIGDTQKKST